MCHAPMGSALMFGGGPLSAVVRGPFGEDQRAERIDGERSSSSRHLSEKSDLSLRNSSPLVYAVRSGSHNAGSGAQT